MGREPGSAFSPERPSAAAIESLAERLWRDAEGTDRFVLGIAGSPGGGKTTLAKALVKVLNRRRPGAAVYVPMDGFHLANATLDRLGRRERKGALDTFDGWGFVALLERIRRELGNTVYAPSFQRAVDEGVAGAVAIEPTAAIVVIEGNYLLMDEAPWDRIRSQLDAAWFCSTDESERLGRLIARHTRHGRTPDAAEAWAREVDGANAARIERTATRADLVVSGTTGEILSGR